MAIQSLDQMLSFVPQSSPKLYNASDVYAFGTCEWDSVMGNLNTFGYQGNSSNPLGDLNIGSIGKRSSSLGYVSHKQDYL